MILAAKYYWFRRKYRHNMKVTFFFNLILLARVVTFPGVSSNVSRTPNILFALSLTIDWPQSCALNNDKAHCVKVYNFFVDLRKRKISVRVTWWSFASVFQSFDFVSIWFVNHKNVSAGSVIYGSEEIIAYLLLQQPITWVLTHLLVFRSHIGKIIVYKR